MAIEGRSLSVVLTLIICSCLWPQPSPAQAPARLVRDINTRPDPYRESSPTSLVAVGDALYFVADDGVKGRQLWRSDGTVSGTMSLTQIDKGTIGNVSAVGEGVFFTVRDDGSGGTALWHSDGTVEGTAAISQVGGSALTDVKGTLFFAADDNVHGRELWKSDGTTEGTVLVKDVVPGAGSPFPYGTPELLNVDGIVYFAALNSDHVPELWKSDGTENGTVLVKMLPGNASRSVGDIADVDGIIFFVADDGSGGIGLWRSDGTSDGTLLVKTFDEGEIPSYPANLTNLQGLLLFVAFEQGTGGELWRSDGTTAGTVVVKDINPGPSNAFPGILCPVEIPCSYPFTSSGGAIFFRATDGNAKNELWRSDGTLEGTALVKVLPDIADGIYGLTPFGGSLFFGNTAENGDGALWRTDGTDAGTTIVRQFHATPGESGPAGLTAVGETLFFGADDGSVGYELWKSDGTEAGTVLVKDINAAPGNSAPFDLVEMQHTLFFFANDGLHGIELWRSDGSEAGTALVRDINPGAASAFRECSTTIPHLCPPLPVVLNNNLYFTADDGSGLAELWRSDGTETGTVRVIAFEAGQSDPTSITVVGDELFFSVMDYGDLASTSTLWRSHGTSEGTNPVLEIPDAPGGISAATALAGGLLFSAGNRLWWSDGTATGTNLLGTFLDLGELARFGGMVLFAGKDSAGPGLWRSDGTAAGTALVKGTHDQRGRGMLPIYLTDTGRRLFFSAGVFDREPWVSDGTAVGTGELKDIGYDNFSSSPTNFTPLSGSVYFAASYVVPGLPRPDDTGRELWRSNGTEASTMVVKDIHPGIANAFASPDALPRPPTRFATTDGQLVFAADDGVSGNEPWQSDGTAAGTVEIADICPGATPSDPTEFTVAGSYVFFAALEPNAGRELWAIPREALVTACIADCDENGQVTVDELVKGVQIDLGTLPVGACSAADANHDQKVTVNELASAVDEALNVCNR